MPKSPSTPDAAAKSTTASATQSATGRKLPRAAQLAQALRDNLRRRKAQAQARAAKADGPPAPETSKE